MVRPVVVTTVMLLAISGFLASPLEAASSPEDRVRLPRVVARVLPAVVSIATRHIERDQFNQARATKGLGSGIIVDARGYVLTNNHVVEGAEQIKVTLPDARAFRATLVGADRYTDLAVLKIEGGNLPTVPLGNSARLAVGETVVAIGSPLWIEGGPSVTVGIVSGLGRSMEEERLPILHDLIQTDAAINQGNSGGPLVNMSGEVVGINTALIPSAHGIGFAIAIDSARPVLAQLIATGRVTHRSLGVYAVSLTPQVAFVNDLPIERGALVIRVDEAGPAHAAGLKAGDVIRAVAGQRVVDLHGFHVLLDRQRAGVPLDIGLWRDGRGLVLAVVPVEEP